MPNIGTRFAALPYHEHAPMPTPSTFCSTPSTASVALIRYRSISVAHSTSPCVPSIATVLPSSSAVMRPGAKYTALPFFTTAIRRCLPILRTSALSPYTVCASGEGSPFGRANPANAAPLTATLPLSSSVAAFASSTFWFTRLSCVHMLAVMPSLTTFIVRSALSTLYDTITFIEARAWKFDTNLQ